MNDFSPFTLYNNTSEDAYQNYENKLYPHKCDITDIKTFQEAVRHDHVFGKMENNHRNKENFVSSNVLYGDVDGGKTLEQFEEEFKEIEYYLATSRNHQISKNSKEAVDKFHVYFPLNVTMLKKEFQKMILKLLSKYNYFDTSCKDVCRLFYGFNKSIVKHNSGINIIDDIKAVPIKKFSTINNGRPQDAQRNVSLNTMAFIKRTEGFDDKQIKEFIIKKNDEFKLPMDDNEIQGIINSVCKNEPGPLVIKNYEKIYYITADANGKETERSRTKLLTGYDKESMFDPLDPFFYRYRDFQGNKILFSEKNDIIQSVASFVSGVLDNNISFDFKGNIIKTAFIFEHMKKHGKTYNRFSNTKEKILDQNTRYFYDKSIKPENNGALLEALNEITFESAQDRYKFCAAIFSAFLGVDSDGSIPLFSIVADNASSGKTTIANMLSQIVQGTSTIELDRNETDKQKIGSIFDIANRFILYDNLENMPKKEQTDLSKRTTSKSIPSHFMFSSHGDSVNNKVHIATFNKKPLFDSDLLERAVIIRLIGSPKHNEAERTNIEWKIKKMKNKRKEILANILYFLDKAEWSTKNFESIKNSSHILQAKQKAWSQKIIAILENIWEGEIFNFGYTDEISYAFNQDFKDITDLFEQIFSHKEYKHMNKNTDPNIRILENMELVNQWQETTGNERTSIKSSTIKQKYNSISDKITNYKMKDRRNEKCRYIEIKRITPK